MKDKKIKQCIKCGHTIKDEFFEGVSGPLCKECLKDLMVYNALKSTGFVKEMKKEAAAL